jgi:cardiolipin synthase
MSIPNLITSIRIILVPIFVIYVINDRLLAALVVFVLAGLSDGADGLIARVFEQKTKLGGFLDPLADKILLIASFIVLSVRGLLPPWLTVIVISRDIMILLGVLVIFLIKVDLIIKPSLLSKITTCFQLGTVFAVLANDYFTNFPKVGNYLFWATAILTISSGLHYMSYWFWTMGEGSSGN